MRKPVVGMGIGLCLCGIVLAFISGMPPGKTAKAAANAAISRQDSSWPALAQPTVSEASLRSSVDRTFAKLPLAFEPNQGQVNPEAKFVAHGDGYTLLLTPREAVFALSGLSNGRAEKAQRARQTKASGGFLPDLARQVHNSGPFGDRQHLQLFRMKLAGANEEAEVSGLNQLPGRSHYIIGNDPRAWHTSIPNFRKVQVKEVYPGIDLLYYGNQRQLEYDFVVRPGHDPCAIQLEFEDAAHLRIDADGDLVVNRKRQQLRFHRPVAYQRASLATPVSGEGSSEATSAAPRSIIATNFVLVGKNRVAFRVGDYDRTKDLVIDPTLAYSTLLGGINKDIGSAIAVDGSGNAYITGETCSPNFPTVTPLPTGPGINVDANCDAFATKLDPTGSTLLYSTFLGGSNGDSGAGIAVDSTGNAYVTGLTSSTDFPTTAGAFQTVYGGGNSDVFIAKLNPAGSALVYSTYLGGSDSENGAGIAVDSSDNANIGGETCSANFPTANAFQPLYKGNCDAFIAKLNPTGSGLIYSTYVGGTQTDAAYAIAVDSLGAAFITGATCSDAGDFPLKNSLEDENAGPPDFPCDAFVTKTGPDGTLAYSTFLGDAGQDAGYGIAVDSQGFAYVTGFTSSTAFLLTPGAYKTTCGTGGTCADAFVSKLSVEGSALVYSTFLGGGDVDTGTAIAVDINENAYVTGWTRSTDFPTANPVQAAHGGGPRDAFVVKLNQSGTGLIFSSYLGGNDDDAGNGIAVDGSGNMYVTGATTSINFPTTAGAFQQTNAGNGDAFVTNIASVHAPVPIFSPTSLNFYNQAVGTTSPAQAVILTNAGDAIMSIIGIQAAGDFGQTNNCPTTLAAGVSCSINVSFTPSAAGIRTGLLEVTDSAANSPQSITLTGGAVIPPPDFALSVLPPSATISAGQSANFALQVSATGGFSQPISLTCSALPRLSDCLVAPDPVTPSGASTQVAITIGTAVRNVAPPGFRFRGRPIGGLRYFGPWLVCLIALLLLIGMERVRRRPARTAAFGFAAVLLLWLAACNSGNPSGLPAGTPAGTYQIVVTGTSGSLSHQVILNLQVN